jgi:hypothetical protein
MVQRYLCDVTKLLWPNDVLIKPKTKQERIVPTKKGDKNFIPLFFKNQFVSYYSVKINFLVVVEFPTVSFTK